METRLLPGTDLALSVVGMGCWTIGRRWWGENHDDRRAIATIHAALDHGINWFDTAPLYGHGHSDRLLATALADRPDALIATKCGVRWDDTDHASSDLRPAHIVADVEASLQRLARAHLDLVQIHWPCEQHTPLDASLGALDRLRERGLIRHYGLCNYSAAALSYAREHGRIACLQTPLSLLRREYEADLQRECQRLRGDPPRACGVLVYETLCRGLLSGRFRQPPRFPTSDLRARDPRFRGHRFAHARTLGHDLGRAAQRVGVPQVALAIGWAASRSGVTAAIVGARTPEQISQAASAGRLLHRSRLWRVITDIAAIHGGWPPAG